MSNIHANPDKYGQRFGAVVVTVDAEAGSCVYRAPRKRRGAVTAETHSVSLHSLDEIQGAYIQQSKLAATDPVAAEIARALKHAGQIIKAKGK